MQTSIFPSTTDERLHTTKSPGIILLITEYPSSDSTILLPSIFIGLIFCIISVHKLEEYIIPACLFGFISFTVSLKNAKGAPVSAALFIINLTISLTDITLLSILSSFTQS